MSVRVLHVLRTLGSGGMERNVRRVVLATKDQGIDHAILLLHHQTEIIELPAWLPVHRAVTGPRDPRMPLLIARAIARVRPTVIHARNWGAWPDTALARLISAPQVPLIWSYHGMESTVVTSTQRLKFQAMEKLTTRLFAVSDAARTLLVNEFGLHRARIGVIANGVDAARFRPVPKNGHGRLPGREGRFIIGAVGRLFEIKNYPMLLRAVHRALQSGADVELRIAGRGPEEQRVRELAAALDAGDRLRLFGHVEDMPAFLSELDLFVLSSDNEANPNALLEAMASGLPCLSTAVGGAREVLDDGRCGLLVPAGDETLMAEAILRLIADPELRAGLGSRARRHVEEYYDQARMIDAYAELYRNPRSAVLR